MSSSPPTWQLLVMSAFWDVHKRHTEIGEGVLQFIYELDEVGVHGGRK